MGHFKWRVLGCAAFVMVIIMPSGIFGRHEGASRCSMWVDAYRAEPVAFGHMLQDLVSVRVVYIGETHSIKRHHDIQLDIVKGLCDSGKTVLLGMEQIERFNQAILDRYNRGEINFETLAKLTDWEKRWNNFRDYRPIMEKVRSCGGTILALNARLETVRSVARKGRDGISQSRKRELPELKLYPDRTYEKLLRKVLSVHAFTHHGGQAERMIDAQILRDETMAQVLSERLVVSEKNMVAVVLAGSGHVNYGLGIPARVKKRVPGVRDRIVLISVSGDLKLTEMQKRIASKFTLTHEDLRFIRRPVADYFHIIGPHKKNNESIPAKGR